MHLNHSTRTKINATNFVFYMQHNNTLSLYKHINLCTNLSYKFVKSWQVFDQVDFSYFKKKQLRLAPSCLILWQIPYMGKSLLSFQFFYYVLTCTPNWGVCLRSCLLLLLNGISFVKKARIYRRQGRSGILSLYPNIAMQRNLKISCVTAAAASYAALRYVHIRHSG